MQIDKPEGRLLGLEIRPRVTGFAVFETLPCLLDWGTRKHNARQADLTHTASKQILALIEMHQPSMIVVRVRDIRSPQARGKIAAILRVIRREARKHSVEVRTVNAKAIYDFFASYQCTSKHQRAALIARWFPELSWKLPPKRKMWKGEDHRMVIFDAAASALALMNRSPPGE